RYAAERTVWGGPIGTHQGVSHPLAKAKIETELAALMIRQAAWQHDHGQPAGESSNMAKYAAAEAAIAAVDAAIQVHGGNGLASLRYERGAALAIASGNSADFLAVYFACAKLGVVCVPVNLGWRPDEVAYVLGHSQARGIVVESQLVTAMQDAVAKVPEVRDVIIAPDDLGDLCAADNSKEPQA